MEPANGCEEVRIFRVHFSTEGVELLRERIKEKLKELMGDYTDDTLVEYVIVLLKNGRSKDEARSELDVFLDEESDSFVSWLWDHLESNLSLYVQEQESNQDLAANVKKGTAEQDRRNISSNLETESENLKPKSSRPRHNRLWKGSARDAMEQPPLQSFVTDSAHLVKDGHHKVSHEKKSSSQPVHRKRKQPEDYLQNKRVVVPKVTVDVTRRLLQFAVRDAVATSRSSKLSDSSLKRLRSVVSTPADGSNIEEPPQRTQSLVTMATAIKAVAEAPKDVKRVRASGNVFNRLGHATSVSDTFNQLGEFDEIAEEEQNRTSHAIRGHLGFYDARGDYAQIYPGSMSLLRSEPEKLVHSESDGEKYDLSSQRQGVVNISPAGSSGHQKLEDFLMNQDTVPYKADEVNDISWEDQVQSVAMSNTSDKLVNAHLPQYQATREIGAESHKSASVTEPLTTKPSENMMENHHMVSANGTVNIDIGLQKELQMAQSSSPGSHPSNWPMEDADSRTIFVSNVHFAATKDSLLRHFNRFGEVLKVIILNDAATGQAKGSAFVEFKKSEVAVSALSLDGTSFMSRLLKVVRKNYSHPEASSTMALPRIARASPFTTMSRYPRVAFPRGIPSMYQARFPIRPGARSMQWKRDSQSNNSGELPGPASSNSNMSTATRGGLTYVRTEPKINQSTTAT